jgi:hypothetical protein
MVRVGMGPAEDTDMVDNRGKPPGKNTDRLNETGAGHVGKDDRGNMTWEWADNDDLQADDTLGAVERMRALVDPTLTVEEDELGGNNPVKSNPKGLTKGYNPYNSGALGKQEWKKKKNLHELSKWIETRKKVQEKGQGGLPDDSDGDT